MGIEVEHVRFSYGDREVLKDVSLRVEDGAFVGLIGPNGSGKSTLMKLIYRVLDLKEGEIRVNGISVRDLPYRKSAQMMAVISQNNHMEFNFTVRDMVMMGRSPYKRRLEGNNAEDARIVDETLRLVNMSGYASRGMHELSGGEQQRVVFARALAQMTDILIMDEPLNQFDITYQLELMKTVYDRNTTVLVSFHDLNMAALFCDYLYCIREGRIVAQGTPDEVLTEENIRRIYHVESEVTRDAEGKVHILYHAGLQKRGVPMKEKI